VRGTDSFNPMIYGRVVPAAVGVRIKVLMTLHPVVWALCVAWSGFLARSATTAGLTGVAMALAPWIMALAFFPSGARRSTALLRQVLHSSAASGPRSRA
jgi:hypothetical protein